MLKSAASYRQLLNANFFYCYLCEFAFNDILNCSGGAGSKNKRCNYQNTNLLILFAVRVNTNNKHSVDAPSCEINFVLNFPQQEQTSWDMEKRVRLICKVEERFSCKIALSQKINVYCNYTSFRFPSTRNPRLNFSLKWEN